MLFEYVAPALQPEKQSRSAATVWSQFPLQPLAPGALTPFSSSVLSELASRAWYLYYDRLGFDPTPRARVVRRHHGHLYFNLSLCAQLEADHAGVEPLMLQLNQQQQSLATWEKPGFLAGFKLARAQKKIDETVSDYSRRLEAITEKARAWYLKTQGIQRWGQAEVLQIMEEIERVGVDGMVAFFAARYTLGQLYGRLLIDLTSNIKMGNIKTPQALLLINSAVGEVSGLVESAILAALPTLANSFTAPEAVAWLKAGDFANWRTALPSPAAIEQVTNFIGSYGHRAVHEGEIANPRWSEDAGLLMAALFGTVDAAHTLPAGAPPKSNRQNLLDALPSSARKEAEQSLQKIAELHKMQSQALHALAYIWAGTRSWALAAAREAMVDKRLHSTDEVFLFELEEIKQMMTGEWNISSLDEIRATVAQRQREQATIRQAVAPDLLVGDDEAFATQRGLPGVAGKVSGPLTLWDQVWEQKAEQAGRTAVIATELLDSGCVLALPLATAFVAAAGTPCDPFVVAAQRWQKPVVVGLGKSYRELVDGATTTVAVSANPVADAGADAVKVSQG